MQMNENLPQTRDTVPKTWQLCLLVMLLAALMLSMTPANASVSQAELEERGCNLVPCDNGWPERGWTHTGDAAWSLERAQLLFGFNPFDPQAIRRQFSADFGASAPPSQPPPVPPPTEPPTQPPPTQPPPTEPPVEPPVEPPTEPPANPPMLTVTGDLNIDELHEVGGSPCPQVLGTFTLSNTGGGVAGYSITGVPAWAELVDQNGNSVSAGGDLAAGQSITVTLRFTCMSFGGVPDPGDSRTETATLSIAGDDGNGNNVGTQTIPVALEIESPEDAS